MGGVSGHEQRRGPRDTPKAVGQEVAFKDQKISTAEFSKGARCVVLPMPVVVSMPAQPGMRNLGYTGDVFRLFTILDGAGPLALHHRGVEVPGGTLSGIKMLPCVKDESEELTLASDSGTTSSVLRGLWYMARQDEIDMKQATLWRNFRIFAAASFKSEEDPATSKHLQALNSRPCL